MSVKYSETVLENGLRIVGETSPSASSAAIGFFVQTGARDEATPLMGVSHFLEHMMFKGTESLSADEINRGFDELGATNNAFTSREMTCFYAHTLPEGFESSTELLSKMMRPAIREEDFNTEKSVILEEIAMYQDQPFWKLYENTIERRYGSAALGHRVLGTPETIKAMDRDEMNAYFEDRYASDNTVVSIAGNADFDSCVELIRNRCGSWTPSGTRRDATVPDAQTGSFEIRDPQVSRGYLVAVSRAPGVEDRSRHACSLLAQILGGSDNSRLHWALIETGIAEEAMAAYDGLDRTGEFFVYASGNPDRLDEIEGVIREQIRSLKDTLEQDDLEKLRAKAATALTVGSERPHDRMLRLGRVWTTQGKYISLEDDLAALNAVTLDDLRTVIDAYPIDSWLLGRMLPEVG